VNLSRPAKLWRRSQPGTSKHALPQLILLDLKDRKESKECQGKLVQLDRQDQRVIREIQDRPVQRAIKVIQELLEQV